MVLKLTSRHFVLFLAACDCLAITTSSTPAQESTYDIVQGLLLHGQYEQALDHLDNVRADEEDDADWHVARVEVLLEVGRYADAIAAAQRALELEPRHSAARRLQGQLCEVVGRTEDAIEAYAWFDALLKQRFPFRADMQTDAGIAIYRHAVLTRRRDLSQRTRYALQDLFQIAYERVEPDYWPARMAAADLLLSKYNLDEAKEDYLAAIEIEPDLAGAHVGLGMIALAKWDFEMCEAEIARALEINPKCVGACCLQARLSLTTRDFTKAEQAANQALRTNPNHLEAMGLAAAACHRQGRPDDAARFITRAEAVNPSPAITHAVLGEWLAAERQYEHAEQRLRQAIADAPHWSMPMTTLGLMYMQDGHEHEARRILEASWQLDPFNAKTKHTLDLIDDLDRFGRHETTHFIVKSQDNPDGAIRAYVAAYLESIYPEITRDYGGEPTRKTIIEIFPDHRSFAVRITGNPWIHTIGACTGPVIAMDAPRPDAHPARFNWAEVLRHEFVHTVTLAATGYRIPHWFTEGLAVHAQHPPRSYRERRLLMMAYRTGRLFELEAIDWGFARPRSAIERPLAYAQSEWMVEFIIEVHGRKAIDRMLAAFRAEPRQDRVFYDVLNVTPQTFRSRFLEWAGGQITSWNMPATPIRTAEELQTLIDEAQKADKIPLLVELTERALFEEDINRATAVIDEAMAISKNESDVLSMALRVLLAEAARVQTLEQRNTLRDTAGPLAEQLLELQPDNIEALHLLGSCALEEEDHDTAVGHFETMRTARPDHPLPYEVLMKVYLDRGETDKALPIMLELARLENDRPQVPKGLAKIYEDRTDVTNAIHWYHQAIQIDPYDRDVHANLGTLLMEAKRYAEAVEEFSVLIRIEPGNAGYHSRSALALYNAGRKEEARIAAERAVALDPHCEAAALLK